MKSNKEKIYKGIFKRAAISNTKIQTLNIEDIYSTIPKKSTEKQNKELCKTEIEWRWRLLKFNKATKLELSRYDPNAKVRSYLNNEGAWCERNVDKKYDEYVTKQFFYYTNC